MDTSSYGRVIEALLAIPTQSQYVSLFADTTLQDGPWRESDLPPNLVAIGYDDNGEAETDGTGLPATFGAGGAGRRQEDYGVPCKILRWTGDTDGGAQKRVRDGVLAQYAAYQTTIQLNPTLSALIAPSDTGQPLAAWIESERWTVTDPDSTSGRMCAVMFSVYIQNSLNF